jgi:tetratricopeptide (TPR) repeat protein
VPPADDTPPRKVEVLDRQRFAGISGKDLLGDLDEHLGAAYARAGSPETGLDHLRAALRIARERGDQHTLVEILNTIGTTLYHLGRVDESAAHHRQACDLATEAGLRYEQARALDGIAHACAHSGDVAAARGHRQDALRLHRELGTAAADEIVRILAALDEPAPR